MKRGFMYCEKYRITSALAVRMFGHARFSEMAKIWHVSVLMTDHRFTMPGLGKVRRGLRNKISSILSREDCKTSHVDKLNDMRGLGNSTKT